MRAKGFRSETVKLRSEAITTVELRLLALDEELLVEASVAPVAVVAAEVVVSDARPMLAWWRASGARLTCMSCGGTAPISSPWCRDCEKRRSRWSWTARERSRRVPPAWIPN